LAKHQLNQLIAALLIPYLGSSLPNYARSIIIKAAKTSLPYIKRPFIILFAFHSIWPEKYIKS